MTRVKTVFVLALLVAMTGSSALARGSAKGHSGGRHADGARAAGHYHIAPRARLGVFVAAPVWYYLPPLGYVAAVTATTPQVYIEQGNTQAAAGLAPGYWYYCTEARAYYPEVKECPGTWQPVAPSLPQTQ